MNSIAVDPDIHDLIKQAAKRSRMSKREWTEALILKHKDETFTSQVVGDGSPSPKQILLEPDMECYQERRPRF